MKSARTILITALATTTLAAGTAHAMPAHDSGHWTGSTPSAASAKPSPELLSMVVSPRRGPLAV